jgi:hypothetical protein
VIRKVAVHEQTAEEMQSEVYWRENFFVMIVREGRKNTISVRENFSSQQIKTAEKRKMENS